MHNNMIDTINKRLNVLISDCSEPSLREAMSYSVSAGGKRLRPMLLLGACEAANGSYDYTALDFACALEMIHCYSLIHDDLPAMDNDDLRRGKPTCHIRFGEAMAILAGDALLNLAYEIMITLCVKDPKPQNLQALQTIATAAGASGMLAGQVLDKQFENKKIDDCTLSNIHSKKTGALFRAPFEAGALLGNANTDYVSKMRAVGEKLGLAFQLLDDLLDVSATEEQLGKPIGSDSRNQKNSYVSVHGLETAKSDYKRISAEAIEMLDELPHKTNAMRDIVLRVIERSY